MIWIKKLITKYSIWDFISNLLSLGVTIVLGMTLLRYKNFFYLILAFILIDTTLGVIAQLLKKRLERKKQNSVIDQKQ